MGLILRIDCKMCQWIVWTEAMHGPTWGYAGPHMKWHEWREQKESEERDNAS